MFVYTCVVDHYSTNTNMHVFGALVHLLVQYVKKSMNGTTICCMYAIIMRWGECLLFESTREGAM